MISFFANRNGSGEIRGRQIAEYLGARLNPTDGYADDVCIWVKRQPPDDHPERTYLDVLDGRERLPWLIRHSDVWAIASSATGARYMRRVLSSPMRLIPQHHCNIERRRYYPRLHSPRLGFVGGDASRAPAAWGVTQYQGRTRAEVVDAYSNIDVQVIWRQTNRPLKNPLKIINAASFGIPTIAYPEPCYEEMEGFYWPARNEDEFKRALCEIVGTWDLEHLVEKAEEYHIERIAQLYRELE